MSRRRSTSRVGPIGTVQPELRRWWPNTIPLDAWPGWEPSGPADEFHWFGADIGPAGDPRTDHFQVAVATPRGSSTAGRIPNTRCWSGASSRQRSSG